MCTLFFYSYITFVPLKIYVLWQSSNQNQLSWNDDASLLFNLAGPYVHPTWYICITTPNLILKIKRNVFYLVAKPKKRKRILNERSPHSFYCDFICPLGKIYMFQYKVKLYCFKHIKVVINLMETIW